MQWCATRCMQVACSISSAFRWHLVRGGHSLRSRPWCRFLSGGSLMRKKCSKGTCRGTRNTRQRFVRGSYRAPSDTRAHTGQTSVPEWDRQFRLVRVHHEHREELGRLRLAGIGADAVAVAGQLGEALSGVVGRHWSVVDLTADRPLKHGRVDEGGFGMRVTRRVAAPAVFDEHALDALAGNVRQLVLVDEGHLGVLLLRRIREDAAQRQGGDKQRTEDAFHEALSFGWRIRLLPVSGEAIRRNRCGRGALRPTARASAPRPGGGSLEKYPLRQLAGGLPYFKP